MPTLQDTVKSISTQALLEKYNNGELIARCLDRAYGINGLINELIHLQSSTISGNQENVIREGNRNRSATLLVPEASMRLFLQGTGLIYAYI